VCREHHLRFERRVLQDLHIAVSRGNEKAVTRPLEGAMIRLAVLAVFGGDFQRSAVNLYKPIILGSVSLVHSRPELSSTHFRARYNVGPIRLPRKREWSFTRHQLDLPDTSLGPYIPESHKSIRTAARELVLVDGVECDALEHHVRGYPRGAQLGRVLHVRLLWIPYSQRPIRSASRDEGAGCVP